MMTEQKYSNTFNIQPNTGRLFLNLISIVPPAKRGPISLKKLFWAIFISMIVCPVFAALDLFIRATFQTIYKKNRQPIEYQYFVF
jgi:hypothetical protein